MTMLNNIVDENIIKNTIKQNGIFHILQTDKYKSFKILVQRPDLIKYLNNDFLDKEFIKYLSFEGTYITDILNFIPKDMITDEMLIYWFPYDDFQTMCNIIKSLDFTNTELIKKLLEINSNLLYHIPQELITDELILHSIEFNCYQIENILKTLDYNDRGFAKKCLIKNQRVLQYMPDDIKNDFEFLYDIAKKDDVKASIIFRYASDEIKINIEFILKFTALDTYSIRFINSKYYNNFDIILCYFKNSPKNDSYNTWHKIRIPKSMFQNKEIAYYAIGLVPYNLIEDTLQNNIEIVSKAIQKDKNLAKCLPIKLLLKAGCHDIAIDELDNIDLELPTLTERYYTDLAKLNNDMDKTE